MNGTAARFAFPAADHLRFSNFLSQRGSQLEITIDVRLVRRIVAQETKAASAEIQQLGPVAAYVSSQRDRKSTR